MRWKALCADWVSFSSLHDRLFTLQMYYTPSLLFLLKKMMFCFTKKGTAFSRGKHWILEKQNKTKQNVKKTQTRSKRKIDYSPNRYLLNTHYVPITIQKKVGFYSAFKYIYIYKYI